MKSKVKIKLFLTVDREKWKNSDIIALINKSIKNDVDNINALVGNDNYKIGLEKVTDENITDIK